MKYMVPDAPRAKNAAATRQAMLAAARSHFLRESYENVGLREVAAGAGVDVALVSRYFGSKEELFKEVLRDGKAPVVPPGLSASGLAAHLASLVTQGDKQADDRHLERLLIILRSTSSPKAAELVRAALHEDVLAPLVELLTGEEAETRASLAIALLMGTTILRTFMAVEPMCQQDCGLESRLTKTFEAALQPAGDSAPQIAR